MESDAMNTSLPEEQSQPCPIPGFSSMDEFTKCGYAKVTEAIKTSNSLPSGKTYKQYQSFAEFSTFMNKEADRLQEIMQLLLSYHGMRRRISEHPLDSKFDVVIDCNDRVLDRMTLGIDEMEGIRRNPQSDFLANCRPISGSWNKPKEKDEEKSKVVPVKIAPAMKKPQTCFKDKVDNSNSPWVPRIKEKPNAIKPLAILLEHTDLGDECYSHPYDFELNKFKPRDEQLAKKKIKPFKTLEETSLVYVENKEQLKSMLDELVTTTELAVDLEHHSYRSFLGFTCLMQISTHEKDYIIDAIALRDHLHILNTVLTNPKIVKVFHGAELDVEWLQRDLSLYVVNMFDTYHASKLLGFPKLNLAYLLKLYCNFNANKHYQLFDWRIRPLPEEAKFYARADTHFLLYIYAKMNNDLLSKTLGKTNLLEAVFQRSTETCRRMYLKPTLDEESHMKLYRKYKKLFDNRQLYALKEVFRWRDRVAREQDESTSYVLPNHMMMQICETLPREMQGILACCNPIPPLVRQCQLELHKIILKAREQPLVKTLKDTEGGQRWRDDGGDHQHNRLLYTHDHGHIDYRDDLPTLLSGTLAAPVAPPPLDPVINFDRDTSLDDKILKVKKMMGNIKFTSPYERYKKVLPYSMQEEKEERERQEKEELEKAARLQEELEAKQMTSAIQAVVKKEEEEPLTVQSKGRKRKVSCDVDLAIPDKTELLTNVVKLESDDDAPPSTKGISTLYMKKKKRFKKHQRQGSVQQNSPSIQTYDYGKVDYSKFQSDGNSKNSLSPHSSVKSKGKRKQHLIGKHTSNKKRGGGGRWNIS